MRPELKYGDAIDLNCKPRTFTTSGMYRWEACPASAVFVGPPRKQNGAMWYGIFVHRFLEYAVDRGAQYAIDYIRSKAATGKSGARAAETCLKIDTDALPKTDEVEVSFCQDIFTGWVRRPAGIRDKARPHEAFGKADIVFTDGEGDVHVADYKTGITDGDPAENTQLLGLACALRWERGVETVKGSLVGVAQDGALHWNTVRYSKQTLDAFDERMKRVHLKMLQDRSNWEVWGEVPDFEPGEHCKFCSNEAICERLGVKQPNATP